MQRKIKNRNLNLKGVMNEPYFQILFKKIKNQTIFKNSRCRLLYIKNTKKTDI